MGWLELLKLAGAGSAGAAIAVIVLFVNEIVVPGKAYQRKCAELEREREDRKAADKRVLDTIPLLLELQEQLGRVPVVVEKTVEKAAEVVKSVGGK